MLDALWGAILRMTALGMAAVVFVCSMVVYGMLSVIEAVTGLIAGRQHDDV